MKIRLERKRSRDDSEKRRENKTLIKDIIHKYPNFERKNVQILLNSGLIESLDDIEDENVRYVLSRAKPWNLKSLTDIGWISSLKDFDTYNIRFVLEYANLQNIEYLIEQGFITALSDFYNADVAYHILRAEYNTMVYRINKFKPFLNEGKISKNKFMKLVAKIDIRTIKFLEKIGLGEVWDLIDWLNIQRIVVPNMELYKNVHPLTIAFATYEDYRGDIAHLDKQIREAVKELEIKEPFDKEKLLRVLDSFINMPDKLNRESTEDKSPHSLYLYIRQGHGEMCSLRATIIARALQKYIESGYSKIFTDIKVVPYKMNGPYPSIIEDLLEIGIYKVYGGEFVNLDNTGDVFGLTHFDASEHTKNGGVPLVTVSTAVNPWKIPKDFVVVPLLFDIRDKYTPSVVRKFSKMHITAPHALGGIFNGIFRRKSLEEKFPDMVKNSRDLKGMVEVVLSKMPEWEEKIIKSRESHSIIYE